MLDNQAMPTKLFLASRRKAKGNKMTRNEKIYNAIQTALRNGTCTWSDIVKSVEDAKIPVKNWMHVRGVMQWMINEKIIVRIKDIHTEQYSIV